MNHSPDTTTKRLVLVLGGSAFVGRDLLNKLSKLPDIEIHYINRGKSYWNDEVKQIPHTHFTYGNRDEGEEFTQILKDLSTKVGITQENGRKWNLVVDFCAFCKMHAQSVVAALNHLVNLYIFISSDAVYATSDPTLRTPNYTAEECAIFPEDKALKKEYKENRGYCYNKLKIEEFLKKMPEREQFPFISLRLSTVIGPYDSLGRLWPAWEWIKLGEEHPLEIDESIVSCPFSTCNADDVTDLIIKISGMLPDTKLDPKILYESYNIGSNEVVTLTGLLRMMADHSGLPLKIKLLSEPEDFFFYLVSTSGPLDLTKSKKILGWNPKPLRENFLQTMKFFSEARNKYPQDFAMAMGFLPEKIRKLVLDQYSTETSE